jgi:hypothetical protein
MVLVSGDSGRPPKALQKLEAGHGFPEVVRISNVTALLVP